MKMINILMLAPSAGDITSYYRAWGVFPYIRKRTSLNINLIRPYNNIDWSVLVDVDMVYMQRPFRAEDLQVASLIARHGIPLWVDFDDMLWGLRRDNAVYNLYKSTGSGKYSMQVAEMADVVTVSTDYLGGMLPDCNNVITIPNAINDYQFPKMPIEDRKNVILWRGSKTHDADFDSVLDEWKLFLMNYGHSVEVAFIGSPYWKAVDLAEKYAAKFTHETDKDFFRYIEYIDSISPKVIINPLADNEFNRCKSNIAMLEGAIAGAVCVSPDFDEWGNSFTYGNNRSFSSAIVDALNFHDHEGYVEKIFNEYSLSTHNETRVEIIKALAEID